jgi:hypothetical protein
MRPLLESLRRNLHVDAQNDYLGSIGVEPGGAGLSNIRDYYGQPLRVLMALVGVVLLLRKFWNLKSINPRFDQTVFEAHLDTSLVGESGIVLGNRLVGRLSTISGVQTAVFSQFGFGQGSNRVCCIGPDGCTLEPAEDKNVRIQPVSPGYFRAQSISDSGGTRVHRGGLGMGLPKLPSLMKQRRAITLMV